MNSKDPTKMEPIQREPNSFAVPKKSILPADFWGDAKINDVIAVRTINPQKRFTAILRCQAKKHVDGWVYVRTLEYQMMAPAGYAPKYRANINVAVAHYWSGSGYNIQQQINSPDTMRQDGYWYEYIRELSLIYSTGPDLRIGIEVDFDGPDGGGWFWEWQGLSY